jgi:hypothetical protein
MGSPQQAVSGSIACGVVGWLLMVNVRLKTLPHEIMIDHPESINWQAK